jgi:hypothetical protein
MAGNAWGGSWNGFWGGSWGEDAGGGIGTADGSWACSWNQTWANSWGDTTTCSVDVTPPTPPAVETPAGHYYDWWLNEWERIKRERAKKRKKVPKKKRELLEELDERLDELYLQAETYTPSRPDRQELKRIQAFADLQAYNSEITLAMVRERIRFVEELLMEMDDEEAILLAIH